MRLVSLFAVAVGVTWLSAAFPLSASVVINEIHYDAEPKTDFIEFVELYNAGPSPVDLSGWRLAEGIRYTIPPFTQLNAGAYLVIAENPSFLISRFALSPSTVRGPYTNALSGRSDLIELRDAGGVVIDRVSYNSGFPWPSLASGGGSSMELINPAFDNDLGGSWRSSGALTAPPQEVVFLAPGSTGWRYRKGNSEASSPVDAWRELGFAEDGTWASGQTPIGYGDSDDVTVLNDMQNGYSTVYLRHTFTVNAGEIPPQLLVRAYIDDGCVVWINGVEVARFSVGGGQLAFNALGINHEAAWEETTLLNPGAVLVEGENIIAIHGINATLGSSDFSVDAELRTPTGGVDGAPPTPGAQNSVYATNAPPRIRQVAHSPKQPTTTEPVIVTAKVTDPDGVASVRLQYQIVIPGNYIRLSDAAYETGWSEIPMTDSGTLADRVANDDVYSAEIPGIVQVHRRLIRYRLQVEDHVGNALQVPYGDDEQPNFAYFCYNGVPGWSGANQPGASPVQNFPASVMNSLPVYHLIANATDVQNSQYNSGFRGARMLGTMVYEGEVYDHIEFRNRGEFSTYQSGKNKWRFHFTRNHDFRARDNYGRRYREDHKVFNFNACASPWIPANRGMAGMEEHLSFRLQHLAGTLTPRTHFVHFRVVDNANEAPADQYAGDLWGLYLYVEHTDGRMLADRGLPDGNTYKIEGGNGNQRNQGPTQVDNGSDWTTFRNGYNGSQSLQWWRDNVALETYYSFRAINRITSNVDIREGWNCAFYHHPDGHWYPIPWDLDMMIIPETHWQGAINLERMLTQHGVLNIEFKNKCREILDLMFQDDTRYGGQIGQLVEEYSLILNPPGLPLTFADVDQFMWNYNPRSINGHRGAFYEQTKSQNNRGGTWTRTLETPDFEGMMRHILKFMTDTDTGGWSVGDGDPLGYGYNYLSFESLFVDIPATPAVVYVGPPGFPLNDLRFQTTPFDPGSPGNNPTFRALQWRIAEVSNPATPNFEPDRPWKYELDPDWQTDPVLVFDDQIRIPPNVVREGRTYRVRVRMQSGSIGWSHWSAPFEFIGGEPDLTAYQQGLVINEIMYHPPDGVYDGDELEFLELKNVGPITLDLGGLFFSSGITYTFPEGTTLEPGGLFLLARNATAIGDTYPGVVPDGIYTGRLANSGERIAIAAGLGANVLSVEYGQRAPWPVTPDGLGFSLVLHDAATASYRASTEVGGSPGAENAPATVSVVLVNEILSASSFPSVDAIELYNPGPAPVLVADWYLTDDAQEPMKFRIPGGTTIPANGFVTFDEADFNATSGVPPGFSLSAFGEEVYLFSGNAAGELTGYSHGFEFGGAAPGVSFGRHVNSVGEEQFPAQLNYTLGAPNNGPRVGPVVITEIAYHPPAPGDEFVEIQNVSGSAVSLYDVANPTNRWTLSGFGFTFPQGASLAPSERALVVSIDPGVFRAQYGINPGTQVFGPALGNLQDSGENLELRSPAPPTTNGVVYFAVDAVRFNDKIPWPESADGDGPSLQRLIAGDYGDDPGNWIAALSSPGGSPGGGLRPSIISEPIDQLVVLGQGAFLQVSVTGSEPLFYQWRFNGSILPGANSAFLSFPSVQPMDAGRYQVSVYNDSGATRSREVRLGILVPAEILNHPQSLTVRPGTNVVFSVSATSSTPITYQWRFNGHDIPGATGAILSILNVQSSDHGTYDVVVTDSVGSAISDPAQLTVLVDPAFVLPPLEVEVIQGGTAIFSVESEGTLPMGYRWRRSFQTIRNEVLNSSVAFLVVTNVQPSDTNIPYTVVLTNAALQFPGILSAAGFLRIVPDNDADLIPDNWETGNGLDPANPNDADEDPDQDGMTSREEYQAGTDPLDENSFLRVNGIDANGVATLQFNAPGKRTFTVEYRDDLESSPWLKLQDVAAGPVDRVVTIEDPAGNAQRYYRLVAPRQP